MVFPIGAAQFGGVGGGAGTVAPLGEFEKRLPPGDTTAKALACYGLSLLSATGTAPTGTAPKGHQKEQMAWRFVQGRPVSAVTWAFLEWVIERVARCGKRVLVLSSECWCCQASVGAVLGQCQLAPQPRG